MAAATRYYGFKGCKPKEKRTLIQAQAEMIRMVRSVAGYNLDWERDPALLEFFGPPEKTDPRRSGCRKRVSGTSFGVKQTG